jgi:hypothetical protein
LNDSIALFVVATPGYKLSYKTRFIKIEPFYNKHGKLLHVILCYTVQNALTGFTAENLPIAKRVICFPLRIEVSNKVRYGLIPSLQCGDFPFRKFFFRSGQMQVLDIG